MSGQDNPQQLPLWLLGEAIGKLRGAGSNVEALLTAWHGKLAYAASLMVMAVLAAAIVSWRDNVYLAVALSMAVIFVTYALTLFGESMGQRGLLPAYAGRLGAGRAVADPGLVASAPGGHPSLERLAAEKRSESRCRGFFLP